MKKGFEKFHGDNFKDGITVFSGKDDDRVSGTITLAGQKTVVDLLCEESVGHMTTVEGWFDLVLFKDHRVEGDDPILLHNAMTVGGGTFHSDIGRWRTKLYPNLIVYSADALGDDFSIRSVKFNLEHLEKFMPYQDVESHRVGNIAEEDRAKIIKILRANTEDRLNEHRESRKEISYDFDEPQQVHVEHKRPRELCFSILGNDYELRGATSLYGEPVFNTIHIIFPAERTINETLEVVDDCTRFFNQVVFEQLDLLDVSASGSPAQDSLFAEFYMPNLVRPTPKQSSPLINSAYIPFTRWMERTKFIEFLMSWLKKNPERREFRRRVNSTLTGRPGNDFLTQVGDLCAAIDSLPEFTEATMLCKQTLSAMAEASHEVAEKSGSTIELERVRNVLSMLNQTRLRRKLEQLIDRVRPDLEPVLRNLLIKQALRLRQSAAHGQKNITDIEPYALPISQMLSAACVLYDLMTSGVIIEDFDHSILLANRTWGFGMSNLQTLAKLHL